MTKWASKRSFRIWEWNVSHSQLLLRSNRSLDDPDDVNEDVLLKGVFFLNIPDWLLGIEIDLATAQETDTVSANLSRPLASGERIYRIVSAGKHYFVGAAFLRIEANKLPPFESVLSD